MGEQNLEEMAFGSFKKKEEKKVNEKNPKSDFEKATSQFSKAEQIENSILKTKELVEGTLWRFRRSYDVAEGEIENFKTTSLYEEKLIDTTSRYYASETKAAINNYFPGDTLNEKIKSSFIEPQLENIKKDISSYLIKINDPTQNDWKLSDTANKSISVEVVNEIKEAVVDYLKLVADEESVFELGQEKYKLNVPGNKYAKKFMLKKIVNKIFEPPKKENEDFENTTTGPTYTSPNPPPFKPYTPPYIPPVDLSTPHMPSVDDILKNNPANNMYNNPPPPPPKEEPEEERDNNPFSKYYGMTEKEKKESDERFDNLWSKYYNKHKDDEDD